MALHSCGCRHNILVSKIHLSSVCLSQTSYIRAADDNQYILFSPQRFQESFPLGCRDISELLTGRYRKKKKITRLFAMLV